MGTIKVGVAAATEWLEEYWRKHLTKRWQHSLAAFYHVDVPDDHKHLFHLGITHMGWTRDPADKKFGDSLHIILGHADDKIVVRKDSISLHGIAAEAPQTIIASLHETSARMGRKRTQGIEIDGTDEFKLNAWSLATAMGLRVVNFDPLRDFPGLAGRPDAEAFLQERLTAARVQVEHANLPRKNNSRFAFRNASLPTRVTRTILKHAGTAMTGVINRRRPTTARQRVAPSLDLTGT